MPACVDRFFAYAADFEKAVASDDWSLLEPYFTEDAVYEVGMGAPLGGRFEGRAAILAYFKRVLDGFDRRFASREVKLLEGPRSGEDWVWIRGGAAYRAAGAPDFALELEETAHFAGDRIRRLEDRYTPEMQKQIAEYVEKHGPTLGIGARG
jgi:hypothetical protein